MTERFFLDVMLGKLATYLRMCGYDTAYALDRGVEADEEVRRIANAEDRRLVTRDRNLAHSSENALILTSKDIDGQLREVRDAGYDLSLEPARCSTCNGELVPIDPGTKTPEYAPDLAAEPVWRCSSCDQYFWRGSHWADVRKRLNDL